MVEEGRSGERREGLSSLLWKLWKGGGGGGVAGGADKGHLLLVGRMKPLGEWMRLCLEGHLSSSEKGAL